VTAYGIYYKLQNFIFMPGYGLNNASIPIISFNYGAGKKDRIANAIRWALTDVTVIMLIGVIHSGGPGRILIVSLFAVTAETEDALCHGASDNRLGILSLRVLTSSFRACARRSGNGGLFPDHFISSG
jgi:hypothetical protein